MEPLRTQAERDKLVLQWRHLPTKVALDLRWMQPIRHMELDDVIAHGNVALVIAAEKWDESRVGKDGKKATFKTYAYACIRNRLLYVANAENYIARLPKPNEKWQEHIDALKQCQLLPNMSTCELPVFDQEPEEENGDFPKLFSAMLALPPEMSFVLKHRFMNGDGSWKKCAEAISVTQEQAKQLCDEGLLRLRKWFAERGENSDAPAQVSNLWQPDLTE
jgi:DNA-directed RNA polymerase sigma subunit (sigma70/sigma32)